MTEPIPRDIAEILPFAKNRMAREKAPPKSAGNNPSKGTLMLLKYHPTKRIISKMAIIRVMVISFLICLALHTATAAAPKYWMLNREPLSWFRLTIISSKPAISLPFREVSLDGLVGRMKMRRCRKSLVNTHP